VDVNGIDRSPLLTKQVESKLSRYFGCAYGFLMLVFETVTDHAILNLFDSFHLALQLHSLSPQLFTCQ
jgi:hypothetical protein